MRSNKKGYVISTAYETYWATNGTETIDIAESKLFYGPARADEAAARIRERFPNAVVVQVVVGSDSNGNVTVNGYPRKVLKSRTAFRREVWGRYGGRCAYCGVEVPYKDFHMDAYIPSLGHDPKNMMPCCPTCYLHKKGKTPAQFQAYVEGCMAHIRKSPRYQFARRYGLVLDTKKKFTFYYLTDEAKNIMKG